MAFPPLHITPNMMSGYGRNYPAPGPQVLAPGKRFGGLREALGYDLHQDPFRIFLTKALSEARKLIVLDSEHQRISVRHSYMAQMDLYRISVVCMACERKWTAQFDPNGIHTSDPNEVEKEVVKRYIAPMVEQILRCSCFEVEQAALLAEWLTRRLVVAGARGMPYVQVLHDAVEAHLCSPKDVDHLLRVMDVVPEWVTLANSGLILPGGWDGAWTLPILHLPDGHPLKTW